MRRFRRFTAALSSILVLQLSLLGTGTLCLSHVRPGAAHHVMGQVMPGMHEQGPVGVSVAQAADPAARGGCGNQGADTSCGLPCASMSSCSAGVSAPAPTMVANFNQSSSLDLPEPLSTKLGHVIAPDLPPPRV